MLRRRAWLWALVLATLAWCLWHISAAKARQWPPQQANAVVLVQGQVQGVPQWRGHQQRFVLLIDRSADPSLPRQVEVTWYRPQAYLQPGERWQFSLRLTPPHGRHNFGHTRLESLYWVRRIDALGQVVGQATLLQRAGRSGAMDRLRQRMAEQVQASQADLDHAALQRALLLADRSSLSHALRGLLQRTGTAHLLAISGLHVGMVAGLVGGLMGWLMAPLCLWSPQLTRQRMSLICGVLAAAVYAALAGWTLPTLRALIMVLCFALAWSLRRRLRPGQAWCLALMLVLWVDPLAPWQPGFWLSFLAVAALMWGFAWRTGAPVGPAPWRLVVGLVRAQWWVVWVMLPLNLVFFGQWAPVAMVANLIAIPVVGALVLPPLLLAAALMAIQAMPTAVGALLGLSSVGLRVLLSALQALDQWPHGHHAWALDSLPPWWITLLAVAGAFWALGPRAWPARALGLFCLWPLLWWVLHSPSWPGGALHLRLLDVGRGQAILIRTETLNVWVDSGPGDGEGNDRIRALLDQAEPRDRVASQHVLVRSVRNARLDGGLASLQGRWPEATVYTPFPQAGEHACHAGTGFAADGWQFEFLHPSAALPDLGHNSSCVLWIHGPMGRVLIMGMVDQAVEQRLLMQHPDLEVDVLVLADGGHPRSSSMDFVAATQPRWALASYAAYDRRGRPDPAVSQRLSRYGAQLVGTGQCGAIDVWFDPDAGMTVRSARQGQPLGCP